MKALREWFVSKEDDIEFGEYVHAFKYMDVPDDQRMRLCELPPDHVVVSRERLREIEKKYEGMDEAIEIIESELFGD